MTFANAEQAAYWADRAGSWTSREAFHDQVIGPAGWMAVDRLAPRPGQTIVDLGCGTGRTTVELARRVAPGGRVVGVDIAVAMFERARQHLADAGVDNVELVHADVQSSDLGRDRFDGAFSRFGVMFFADPASAFTNVRSALKPGAALSFVCWQSLSGNDWMGVPARAAIAALGATPEAPPPHAPGPFSLCDPSRVRSILEAAGFGEVDIVAHDDLVTFPGSGIPDVADASLQIGAVQRMLVGADPDTVEVARRAITEALEARLVDGQVGLSRAFQLVRATA